MTSVESTSTLATSGDAEARPKWLYHYTDGAALIDIIQTRKLWASEAVYLNDSREITAGVELAKRRLNELIEPLEQELAAAPEGHTFGTKADILSRLAVARSGLEDLARLEEGAEKMYRRPFITCFSADDDALSQWRAYGNYAIGLDAEVLERAVAVGRLDSPPNVGDYSIYTRSGLRLVQVCYTDEEFIGKLNPIFDAIREPGSALGSRGMPYLRLWQGTMEALAQRKEYGFREEHEWRLCYVRLESADEYEPTVKFRSGALTIVPYVELQIDISAIKEIVIGPSGHQDLQAAAVRRVVGGHSISVRSSSIPYRAARSQAG